METKSLMSTSELFPSAFEDYFMPWNEWLIDGGKLSRPLSIPAANITETKDEYNVTVAAPGFKKSDFKIDVNGKRLTVSCERGDLKEGKEARYTRREYNYSSFNRSFSLPEEVNQDKIEAGYEDGILKLRLPKKEEARRVSVSKHIAVR